MIFLYFPGVQIPPAPPIKHKATARWPYALLWFRGGREAPFGVQPELAQQAQTTPKGRPLVVKREVSGKAANKSPQLSSHRKVALCFIVVSRWTRSAVRGSAGACAASADNAQRAASRCQTRGERQSRE
ncbi:hypothetical protein SD53_00330 [Rheinheimera mesophila]|nr:hypothetical protein SD53_00330 [Rheinheimera mesophila]